MLTSLTFGTREIGSSSFLFSEPVRAGDFPFTLLREVALEAHLLFPQADILLTELPHDCIESRRYYIFDCGFIPRNNRGHLMLMWVQQSTPITTIVIDIT